MISFISVLSGVVRAVQRGLPEDLPPHPHLPLGLEVGDGGGRQVAAEPILLRVKNQISSMEAFS